jgi:hypothetical protein
MPMTAVGQKPMGIFVWLTEKFEGLSAKSEINPA